MLRHLGARTLRAPRAPRRAASLAGIATDSHADGSQLATGSSWRLAESSPAPWPTPSPTEWERTKPVASSPRKKGTGNPTKPKHLRIYKERKENPPPPGLHAVYRTKLMERAALPTGRRWAACKLILGGGDRRDRFRWNWTDIAREPSIAHLALELLFLDGRFLYKPGKSVPGVLELDALLPNLSDPSRIDTSPDNFVALAELVRAETPRSLPTVLRTLSVLAALPAPAGAPARAAFEALEQTLQLNEQAWRVEAAQKKSPPGLVPVHKALVAAMSPGSPSASLSLSDESQRICKAILDGQGVPVSPVFTSALGPADLPAGYKFDDVPRLRGGANDGELRWTSLTQRHDTSVLALDMLFAPNSPCKYIAGEQVPAVKHMRALYTNFPCTLSGQQLAELTTLVTAEYDDPIVLAVHADALSRAKDPAAREAIPALLARLEERVLEVAPRWHEREWQEALERERPISRHTQAIVLSHIDTLRLGPRHNSAFHLSHEACKSWDVIVSWITPPDHRTRLRAFWAKLVQAETDQDPADLVSFTDPVVMHPIGRDPVCAIFVLAIYSAGLGSPRAEAFRLKERIAALLQTMEAGRPLWGKIQRPGGHTERNLWRTAKYLVVGDLKEPLGELGPLILKFFDESNVPA